MKAISAIIVVVLLLLISISLISVVYVWSSALTGTVTSTTEETTSELTKQLSGCLKIDAVSKNQIYLRNCGKGVITNNSLSVFIDDVKVEHSLEEIGEDQTGTVNISGLWQFSMDRHNLKLTNGAAFVQALIELEPNKDGLVGYWSFDEGSGNKVYDKSGNGNDGTLLPSGSGPVWTTGKFGSALSFDGVDDYVTSMPTYSLNDAALHYTVAIWFKGSMQNEYWKGIVGKPGRNYNIWLGGSDGNSPYIHHRFHTTASTNDNCPNLVGVVWDDWNFVIITNDGSTCQTYIFNKNGKFYTQRAFAASLISDDSALQIGRNLDGSNSNYFNGIIDEVRIWNKALTPDQTVVMKRVI